MEHLFTSFFRSTAAGSFKEHRMVFQTATPETRFNTTTEVDGEKARIEALIRENPDPATTAGATARTELRTMRTRAFLEGYTDNSVRDAARNAVNQLQALSDSASDSRTEVANETTRLKDQRSEIISAVNLNHDTGITLAVGKMKEASDKLKVLGTNASPEAAKLNRFALTTILREHVKAIQDMATTGKMKIEGTTEVAITGAPLTETQKDKLTKPYSNFTAAEVGANTGGAKEQLGRGYLRGKGATEAGNDYTLKATVAGATVDVAKYSWDAAGNKWTVQFINAIPPALGPAADVAAAGPIPAIAGAPPEVAAILVTQNDILDKMKNGVAIAAPDANKLGDVIRDANAGESGLANAKSEALDKTQRDYVEVDFSQAVRRVEVARDAAGTPEGKVRAIRDEMDRAGPAPKGLRVMANERRDAIWTEIKNLSDAPVRASNYVALVDKLQNQLLAVGAGLRDKEVAFGLRTAPTTAPVTPPAGVDSLPVAERAPVEAFNNFLRDNAVVNALTDVETTRKPAIDAIVAQLPTLTTDGQRKLGRAAVEAKMTAKGYTVTALEFSPARLEIRRTAEAAPVTPEITTFLGTETERNTLRDALRTNVATPDALPVRNAITAFQGRLAAVPEGQRAAAVARLNETVRVPATATTDGLEIAINGTNLEARRINRAGTTLPPAPERKERAERMSEFMKILIELIRALLQIEQQRTTVMARGVEAQMKLAAQIEAQMKALPPAGRRDPTQEQQFNKMRNDLNRVQGELATFRKQREESIAKANAAIARRPNNTLVVEADADIRRPVRVCVRRGVNLADAGVSARVSADINFVRADSGLPLVATTSPSAAAPTRVVPTTAFYVGSVNIDNRATTTATITNSPGARIDASSTARTDVTPPAPRVTPVVRTDAPPPPPRVTGTGRPNPGSLNG